MSRRIKTMEELKDSRILYEKDLPLFGYLLVILILGLLISVTIWGVNTQKTEIIKAEGTVESINKNYVMSPFTGKISKISIKEGKNVEKGDNLFTITSSDLDLQENQYSGQIKIYQTQIKQYEKLIKSIQDDKNYFDASKESDKLYYNQYQTYQSQIDQQIVDTASLKSYGYSDDQIKNEIKKNESKKTEIYYSTLKTVTESLNTSKNDLKNLQVQLNTVNKGQKEYIVKANATGKIHMTQDYKKGMIVQAASALASIASESDQYMVQAYLSASDMARIKVGDDVDLAVSGLVQNVYGTIPGKVTQIDSDITVNSETNKSYFKIKVRPDISYLVSKKGNKVNISNGMQVEAGIQYEEVTYFNYVMESLGVLSR